MLRILFELSIQFARPFFSLRILTSLIVLIHCCKYSGHDVLEYWNVLGEYIFRLCQGFPKEMSGN